MPLPLATTAIVTATATTTPAATNLATITATATATANASYRVGGGGAIDKPPLSLSARVHSPGRRPPRPSHPH